MIPKTFKTYKELQRKRDILEREGNFIKTKKEVDICIPAYREEGYIEKTIDSLMNQTMWKDGLMNIVVGEYSHDPQHLDGTKTSYLKELCFKNKVIHVFVPKKGVGFARNHTILNGSLSDIITTFDADSRFNRDDAMELLIEPIKEGRAVATYCNTILVRDNLLKKESFGERLFKTVSDGLGDIERLLPIGRSLGLTFTRQVFFKINGFPLVNLTEDYVTHYRICYHYGMFQRKFVPQVIVLSSDRRAAAIAKYGLNVINYDKNYR